jgi:uncharacterized membrane protein YdjX (TVP38/TMEM64 family)
LNGPRIRYPLLAVWLLAVGGALYLYFFHRELLQAQLQDGLSAPTVAASALYMVLGSLRAFTLVPASFLLFAAIPFFNPWLLLALTLLCIAVSSSLCYWFADALNLDDAFGRKYPDQIRRLTALLQRNELPIIIGWSFMLFLPTDLICYLCGSLRINYPKFLVGVLIGEGAVYSIYIFAGDYALRHLPNL